MTAPRHPTARLPLPPRRPARPGFTFVEVLFAVMILGIGFIMLAGIFPVAMRQAADTMDDTLGMGITRKAASVMSDTPALASVPTNGAVARFEGPAWDLVRGNQINPDDPRYGWVALARRQTAASPTLPDLIQLIVVPVQVRAEGRSRFDDDDFRLSGNVATLLPAKVKVKFAPPTSGAGSSCTITEAEGNSGFDGGNGERNPAATGAVLVVANGPLTGRPVRLGQPINNSRVQFELMPGNDVNDLGTSVPTTEFDAFLVGRGLGNPGGGNEYSGPSMAVGVYTTYVRPK